MDAIKSKYANPILAAASVLLVLTLSLIVNHQSYAHEVVPSCQIATIKPAFHKYLISATQQQVVEMQTKLEQTGYGKLKKDGVLGLQSRRALQRLCLDFEVDETKDTVETLLHLLNLTYTVSKTYPDWRTTIKSDAFIQWQGKQEDHEAIHVALHIGPAQQDIEILDRFTRWQAGTATDKAATEKAAAEKAAAEKAAADKAAADKAAAEKAAAEKAAAEKAAAEKAAAEKAAAEKVAAEKVAAENKAAEKVIVKKVSAVEKEIGAEELVYYQWPAAEEPDEEKSDDGGDKEPVAVPKIVPIKGAGSKQQKEIDKISAQLALIEGEAYPNEFIFRQALQQLFANTAMDVTYRSYLEQIIKISRKGPADELGTLNLDGGGCGCSKEYAGEVYGFYPYWLAQGNAKMVSPLNLLDRVAYYAVSIDLDRSNELNLLQWSEDAGAGDFIRTAHRHRVKVDVVMRIVDWQNKSEREIKRVTKKIVEVAEQQFIAREPNAALRILPVVGSDKQVKADGVTLYFDNYKSGDSMDNVVAIVEQVTKQLRKDNNDYVINLLLDVDVTETSESGDIIDVLTQLKDVLVVDKNGDGIVDPLSADQIPTTVTRLMLYLPAPSSDSKKILRKRIEDAKAFDGEVRDTVYHMTVPILKTPDSEDEIGQYNHDLIYLKRNYGGVGLWLLPLADNAVLSQIEDAFTHHYRPDQHTSLLGEFMESEAAMVCEFACPNRWLFRVGFDLLAGVLFLYALLAIWNCRLRSLYKEHAFYFIAYTMATLLVFLVSLVCDPFWAQRADSVVIAVILVALVFTIASYVRKALQPPLP